MHLKICRLHEGLFCQFSHDIESLPCSTERGTEGETVLRCCLLRLLFVFQVNWFTSLKPVVVDGYLILWVTIDSGFLFRTREPAVWVVSETLKNWQFMQQKNQEKTGGYLILKIWNFFPILENCGNISGFQFFDFWESQLWTLRITLIIVRVSLFLFLTTTQSH